MAADPRTEAEIEANRAVLAVALGQDDVEGALDAMIALADTELCAGNEAQALGWVEAAEERLAQGRGGVQVRARVARQRSKVTAQIDPETVAAIPDLPAPQQRPSPAALDAARAAGEQAVAAAEAKARAATAAAQTAIEAQWTDAIAAAGADAAQRATLLTERAKARVEAGRRGEAAGDVQAAGRAWRESGARVMPPELVTLAERLGVHLEATDAGAPRTVRLNVGRRLAELPDDFAYARDDGPPIPTRVRFVAARLAHRGAGWGSTVLLMVLGLTMAGAAGLGSMAWIRDDDFNAWVSLGIAAVAGALGWLVAWRMRTARADARRQRLGTYRIGVYFDGDAMLWRTDAGWSLFPRERVEAASVESTYHSETKFTARRAEMRYRDDAGQVHAWSPGEGGGGIDPTVLVGLIERWRQGRPIHD